MPALPNAMDIRIPDYAYKRGVTGSNPVAPTRFRKMRCPRRHQLRDVVDRHGPLLRIGRGDRGCTGRLEGGGKQVASRQAAVIFKCTYADRPYPVPPRIHPGGAAGNHSGVLKSLHAQVVTGPGDVQASRQRPHGNAPVLAQHRPIARSTSSSGSACGPEPAAPEPAPSPGLDVMTAIYPAHDGHSSAARSCSWTD